MTDTQTVAQPVRKGKVRDIYDCGDGTLLLVASDRVSAFDVVLPTPVPDRGRVLTAMSRWWFQRTSDIVPNHLLDTAPVAVPEGTTWEQIEARTMHVRKADRIDVECVVRGYLAGSGWKEYATAGTLAGEPLPSGLKESSRLPEPRFTPAIKNDTGHDENISRAQLAAALGRDLAKQLEEVTLALFRHAHAYALGQGLILADTKFEFGLLDGKLVLIDEALTPDSSRYWDAATYRPGSAPPSYDKQFVRDFLNANGWDHEPPGPKLPAEVVRGTTDRYRECYRKLTGKDLE
jgi:phosphoribosylaminoimidazole-succinocarboxamide synthase